MFDDVVVGDTAGLIVRTLEEKDFYQFLLNCFFIYRLENEKSLSKKVRVVLDDESFMREVFVLGGVKDDVDNRILYYQDNRFSPVKLSYNGVVEKKINSLKLFHVGELAVILKRLQGDNIELQ